MLVGGWYFAAATEHENNVGVKVTSRRMSCFSWGARLPREGIRRAVQLQCAQVEEQSFSEVVHHSQPVTVSKHHAEETGWNERQKQNQDSDAFFALKLYLQVCSINGLFSVRQDAVKVS